MTYVDGFVVPVPKDKIENYRNIAQKAGEVWKEHGALSYKECVLEDGEDKGFCQTFPAAFNPKPDETIVFAYIEYRSREHRDEVNAKVMADDRMQCADPDMPFDCKRMAFSGFSAMVDL